MNNSGYWCVKLSKGGNLIHFLIHILVAQHYIPNPQNLPEVNHKDISKQKLKLHMLIINM